MVPGRDIVVVAASAGGLQPLRSLLSDLPANLPAALFVMLHVPATGGQTLPRILDRAGPLPADSAAEATGSGPGGSTSRRRTGISLRSLDERARLTDRLADNARERGHGLSASQFSQAAEEAKRSANTLRHAVRAIAAEVAAGPGAA
jgi:chemotaxis response regulator CheB